MKGRRIVRREGGGGSFISDPLSGSCRCSRVSPTTRNVRKTAVKISNDVVYVWIISRYFNSLMSIVYKCLLYLVRVGFVDPPFLVSSRKSLRVASLGEIFCKVFSNRSYFCVHENWCYSMSIKGFQIFHCCVVQCLCTINYCLSTLFAIMSHLRPPRMIYDWNWNYNTYLSETTLLRTENILYVQYIGRFTVYEISQ